MNFTIVCENDQVIKRLSLDIEKLKKMNEDISVALNELVEIKKRNSPVSIFMATIMTSVGFSFLLSFVFELGRLDNDREKFGFYFKLPWK